MINVPNLLTVLRILLIPLFVFFLFNEKFKEALFIFFIGCVSDALDGFIARRFNQITDLGKFLDPAADKIFLLSSFTTAYLIQLLPLWFFLLTILKEMIIVSGLFTLRSILKKVEIKPTFTGKLVTTFEMITLALLLLNEIGLNLEILIYASFVTTAVLLVAATFSYVNIGFGIYREKN